MPALAIATNATSPFALVAVALVAVTLGAGRDAGMAMAGVAGGDALSSCSSGY